MPISTLIPLSDDTLLPTEKIDLISFMPLILFNYNFVMHSCFKWFHRPIVLPCLFHGVSFPAFVNTLLIYIKGYLPKGC
tara:strand:- start:1881 stop:2117 length:237 start_codon:yes stop_codon:yes gene_type:complete